MRGSKFRESPTHVYDQVPNDLVVSHFIRMVPLRLQKPIHEILFVLEVFEVMHALCEARDAEIGCVVEVGEFEGEVGVLCEEIVERGDLADLFDVSQYVATPSSFPLWETLWCVS